jgi:hypothetical protein
VHGSEVQVWRLQPLRDAGLLELTEVPLAWHDESPRRDGTTVCALRSASVVRLHQGHAQQMDFSQISDIATAANADGRAVVTISGPGDPIGCIFGPTEGAGRFARQLESARTPPH